MTDPRYGFSTRAVHADGLPRLAGEVAPALHLSTTFARGSDGALEGAHLYARLSNPNRDAVERTLVALEGGANAALAFASGLAAADALLSALRPGGGGIQGARVVVEQGAYYGVMRQFHALAAAGVEVVSADLTDSRAARAALTQPLHLVWCETPTNPLLGIADIALVASLAHAQGAALVVDNTIATPLLQSPLLLGADAVLHAATKALGGHSDLTMGVLLFADARHPLHIAAAAQRDLTGAAPSPFDCWLLQRGLATAALRVRAQEANARAVAEYLCGHAAVLEVNWPGLAAHAAAGVVAQQMRGGGSLVSVRVCGGDEGAARFMAALQLFTRATSFGGVHSLAEHRWRVEGAQSRTPHDLVRLALGIEDPADLLRDLAQALSAC